MKEDALTSMHIYQYEPWVRHVAREWARDIGGGYGFRAKQILKIEETLKEKGFSSLNHSEKILFLKATILETTPEQIDREE